MTGRDALFDLEGDHLVPLPLGRGPWDHGYLHGSAVCGALGWAVEGAVGGDGSLALTRLTVELHSMVPATLLRLVTTVARPGRRVSVVDAELWDGDRRVARASSQWVAARATDPRPVVPVAVVARPDTAVRPWEGDIDYPRPGFNCDAVDVRAVRGGSEVAGPGLCWVRVECDVVAGRPLSPLQRAAVLSDFVHAVGWDEAPSGESFINADVTLQLLRYPAGEWVLIDAATTSAPHGVGLCQATFSDEAGPVGTVLQSLVERPPMRPQQSP